MFIEFLRFAIDIGNEMDGHALPGVRLQALGHHPGMIAPGCVDGWYQSSVDELEIFPVCCVVMIAR